ncbi:hypothetical protein V5799_017520 [Amblyomma americanum]|uniref:Uncharacterized protein n=1 Tax=Amblyomma americanum TaxID=6943 RepID=A0AAQ4F2A9_AMBAM
MADATVGQWRPHHDVARGRNRPFCKGESKNITACLLHSSAMSWGLTALPAHPDLGKTSMTFPHHAVPGALLCKSAQVLLSSFM